MPRRFFGSSPFLVGWICIDMTELASRMMVKLKCNRLIPHASNPLAFRVHCNQWKILWTILQTIMKFLVHVSVKEFGKWIDLMICHLPTIIDPDWQSKQIKKPLDPCDNDIFMPSSRQLKNNPAGWHYDGWTILSDQDRIFPRPGHDTLCRCPALPEDPVRP